MDHVVAQVIEPEFVIRPVGDVRRISRLTLGGTRVVAIDDIDIQSEKAEHVSHPLGITLSEIGVDRDEVSAAPSQSVQVQWHCRDKRFAFTRRHLGDLAAMQADRTDQLDIVGNHVPGQGLPRDLKRRTDKPTTGILDDSERLRKKILETFLELFQQLLLQVTDLKREGFPLRRVFRGSLLLLEALDLTLQRSRPLGDVCPKFVRLGLKLLVTQ